MTKTRQKTKELLLWHIHQKQMKRKVMREILQSLARADKKIEKRERSEEISRFAE